MFQDGNKRRHLKGSEKAKMATRYRGNKQKLLFFSRFNLFDGF